MSDRLRSTVELKQLLNELTQLETSLDGIDVNSLQRRIVRVKSYLQSVIDHTETAEPRFFDTVVSILTGSSKATSAKAFWQHDSNVTLATRREGVHHLGCSPSSWHVDANPVLSTRFGEMLRRHGRLHQCIAGVWISSILLFIPYNTLGTELSIDSQEGETLHITRNLSVLMVVQPVAYLLLTFMCLHGMNKMILMRSVRQADSLILLLSLSASVFVRIARNWIIVGPTGKYDIFWRVCDAAYLISWTLMSLVTANLDAFRIQRRYFIAVYVLVIVAAVIAMVQATCRDEGWGEPVADCAWFRSNSNSELSLRSMYVKALFQGLLFSCKSAFSRYSGHLFVNLHPQWVRSKLTSSDCQTEDTWMFTGVDARDDATRSLSADYGLTARPSAGPSGCSTRPRHVQADELDVESKCSLYDL